MTLAPGTVGRLAILGYFGLQVLLRLLAGPALFYDEAEALFLARDLQWGYGPQPPLYFWLQWGLFQILGPGLLALALLKFGLFAAALWGILRLLERVAPGWPAVAGTVAVALIPVIGWEAQRAYTHSILALLASVLATTAAIDALQRGTWAAHLRLGLLVGVAALSKLNAPLWPIALLAAAAILPDWRGGLRPARLLAAAAVTAAVVARPFLWAAENPELAQSSVRKLYAAEASAMGARLAGTGSLLLAVLAFSALALVTFGWAIGWRLREARARLTHAAAGGDPAASLGRLLLVALLVTLGTIWAGVLASGATSIMERWFLPVGWALGPAGVLLLWPVATTTRRRALLDLAGLVALVGLLSFPFQMWVRPNLSAVDYPGLARVLEEAGAGDRPLWVGEVDTAGNLLLADPGLEPLLWRGGPIPGEALLVAKVGASARRIDEDPELPSRISARGGAVLPRVGDRLEFVILRLAPPQG